MTARQDADEAFEFPRESKVWSDRDFLTIWHEQVGLFADHTDILLNEDLQFCLQCDHDKH